MKKTTAVLLCLIFVFVFLLSGCQDEESNPALEGVPSDVSITLADTDEMDFSFDEDDLIEPDLADKEETVIVIPPADSETESNDTDESNTVIEIVPENPSGNTIIDLTPNTPSDTTQGGENDSNESYTSEDTSVDTSVETKPETSEDTSIDTTPETSEDTSVETKPETSEDTSVETKPETSEDTSVETKPETSEDTSVDTKPETSEDTSVETKPETSEDTSVDTKPDTSEDTSVDTTPDDESSLDSSQESSDDEASSSSSSSSDIINITVGGTYTLTGARENIMITVDVGEDDVQLILNNITIKNANGPAIYIKSADKATVTLAEGSVNTLSDGSGYSIIDDDSTLDAAFFSRADVTFNGTGKLIVKGNYKHGMVSKDDLVIISGEYDISSKNVGINGKDCVKINNGNITVNSGTDGIRSDNDTDATRGFIYVNGGILNITANNDAFQAYTVLKIDGGDINVKTGGGSSSYPSSSDTESYKGLKAGSDILISGGNININSKDDSVHSNGTITVSGGTLTLSSGDDGIHADTDLVISNGKINVTKSYEGLEATQVVITGGEISLVATDDGINAAGGNDSGMAPGRPGDSFTASNGQIVISGGYTVVNASGDGIDSNGTISVSGGVTLVSGPTSGGNGIFDYDGTATVTGGVLVALGTSDMAQNFSSATNQGSFLTTFTNQNAKTNFAVCDSSGKVIVSFSPAKSYRCAVVTAPEIQSGNTYTLVAGATVSGADANGFARNTDKSGGTTLTTVNMTSNITGSGGMGGGPGGMPGGRPPRP